MASTLIIADPKTLHDAVESEHFEHDREMQERRDPKHGNVLTELFTCTR